MENYPFGTGACCLPAADGITYLKIGERQITVGIQGLDAVFKQLCAMGRAPEDVTDEELIEMARRRNYIYRSPEVEADYAAAFRRAYAGYFARQEKSREQARQV